MGCTSSKDADKDDNAPYSKATPKGEEPNPNTALVHQPQDAAKTGSKQKASGSGNNKKSGEQPKPSKNKTYNKEKEWGQAGQRRAEQNQHTSTQMENFPTGTEKELKALIEKNIGRNKEFYENAEAGGWKVSHVGTDGMVYLENQDSKDIPPGNKEPQSAGTTKNKGNKMHLSDIKMPPPPEVPYHQHPGDNNMGHEDHEGIRTEEVDINMGREIQMDNITGPQYAAIVFPQQGADPTRNTMDHPENQGRDNASFAEDDVAVRIEYLNKDAISKDFISGDQRDSLNSSQNPHRQSEEDDSRMQNTINNQIQNQIQSSHEAQSTPGAYMNSDESSGTYALMSTPAEGFQYNVQPPYSYSNDQTEHMYHNAGPEQSPSGMNQAENIHHAYPPLKALNSPSMHEVDLNEPSAHLAENVLQHTIMSGTSEFVAAIDLGYAYSGYAFLDTNRPSQVEVNRNWASHLGYTSHKTPTAILFNSKDAVQAFGFEAYEKYDQFLSDDEGNMLLYKLAHSFKQKPLDKATWKLISISMEYLKTQCESVISNRYNIDPQRATVNWTIPFPADWDSRDTMSSFKDHMYKAGFQKSRLSIVPDMECALHYCVTSTNMDLKDGKQCLLVSAGESAVCHYVYQYSKKKGWSYVHRARSMAGRDITRLFTKFLGYIFGDNFISELQRVHPSEWYNFINTFDLAKRDISTGMQLQLNYAFENFHREFTGGKTLKDAVHQKSKETGPSVSLTKSGTLKFRHGTLIMLFDAVLRDIENKVKQIVEKFPKVEVVFLVGGLGDCAWVKERIMSGSKGKKIIIPEEPNLCVLKGAVLKGFAKMENAK